MKGKDSLGTRYAFTIFKKSNDILTLLSSIHLFDTPMCIKNIIFYYEVSNMSAFLSLSLSFFLSLLLFLLFFCFSLPYLSLLSLPFHLMKNIFLVSSLSFVSNIHLYCISILTSNKQT